MQIQKSNTNANPIPRTSFKSILNTIVKASSNNIQTANRHWDIFHKPANNTHYKG